MVNFLPTVRLAQSILKHKFPCIDKPLQIYAPQKGPLKSVSPGAYFRNFTVCLILVKVSFFIVFDLPSTKQILLS